MQAEGWQFNTEFSRFFAPDSSGNINIPNGTLRVSLSQDRMIKNNGFNVTVRKNRLYDLTAHTYNFSEWRATRINSDYTSTANQSGVNLDVVTLIPFEELPAVVQRYVTYRAAERAATQLVPILN